MSKYPVKLAPDGIVEAILEVRFVVPPSLAELLLGDLARGPLWSEFKATRLPIADVPAPVRAADDGLRFQPVMQLSSPDSRNAIKLGERVFSWHAFRPYPGWGVFRPQLWAVLEFLFGNIEGLQATRLGFRYLNLLKVEEHHVSGVNDLNIEVSIAGIPVEPRMNLNYRKTASKNHEMVTRIASPDFVSGPKETFSTLVDIDVFTKKTSKITEVSIAKEWVEQAHTCLKNEFFPLLRAETLDSLREDS